MKKILYFLLLAAELALGCFFMYILCAITLVIPCIIIAVVWAALLAWPIVLLFRASDDARKKKLKQWIALAMLIPSAVFIVLFVYFCIRMMIGF